MGTVPISVIYGYKYPLREQKGNFVKTFQLFMLKLKLLFEYLMSSKFHPAHRQSHPGPEDQPGHLELPHRHQQVGLAVQLEQLQTSGDCEDARMVQLI